MFEMLWLLRCYPGSDKAGLVAICNSHVAAAHQSLPMSSMHDFDLSRHRVSICVFCRDMLYLLDYCAYVTDVARSISNVDSPVFAETSVDDTRSYIGDHVDMQPMLKFTRRKVILYIYEAFNAMATSPAFVVPFKLLIFLRPPSVLTYAIRYVSPR